MDKSSQQQELKGGPLHDCSMFSIDEQASLNDPGT